MYVSAPRWRGTSALSRPLSARQIRGLGFTQGSATTDDPANRTVLSDPFGLYALDQGATGPIVRPDYAAAAAGVPYFGAPSAAGSGFSDWLNKNATTVGIVGALAVGLVFVSKAMR